MTGGIKEREWLWLLGRNQSSAMGKVQSYIGKRVPRKNFDQKDPLSSGHGGEVLPQKNTGVEWIWEEGGSSEGRSLHRPRNDFICLEKERPKKGKGLGKTVKQKGDAIKKL